MLSLDESNDLIVAMCWEERDIGAAAARGLISSKDAAKADNQA
jgi:hypothetical protein